MTNSTNNTIRILIADDEEQFASTLATRLQMRGFSIRVADSGGGALAALEEELPDVMVLDLKMPDLDGLEVLAHTAEKYPGLPVIILTGHGSFEAGREGMELGASDYFMKPVDLGILISRIEEVHRSRADQTN